MTKSLLVLFLMKISKEELDNKKKNFLVSD